MISKELLRKYQCFESVEEAKKGLVNELEFYKMFLRHTDYLAMKLAEDLIKRDDKKAEFEARDFARAEINRLQK